MVQLALGQSFVPPSPAIKGAAHAYFGAAQSRPGSASHPPSASRPPSDGRPPSAGRPPRAGRPSSAVRPSSAGRPASASRPVSAGSSKPGAAMFKAGHMGEVMRLRASHPDDAVMQRYAEMTAASTPTTAGPSRGPSRPQSAISRPSSAGSWRQQRVASAGGSPQARQQRSRGPSRPQSAISRPSSAGSWRQPRVASAGGSPQARQQRLASAGSSPKARQQRPASAGSSPNAMQERPASAPSLQPPAGMAQPYEPAARCRTNVSEVRATLDASCAPAMIALRNNSQNLKKRMMIQKSPRRSMFSPKAEHLFKAPSRLATPTEPPVHKDYLWKLNLDGSPDVESDWLKRRFYIFKSGDLCYKSYKHDEVKVIIFAPRAELCSARISSFRACAKEHVFEFKIKSPDNPKKFTSRVLACESAESFYTWMKKFEDLRREDKRQLACLVSTDQPQRRGGRNRSTSKSRYAPIEDPLHTAKMAAHKLWQTDMARRRSDAKPVKYGGSSRASPGWEPSPYRSCAGSSVPSRQASQTPSPRGREVMRIASRSPRSEHSGGSRDFDERLAELDQEVTTRHRQRLTAVWHRLQEQGDIHRDFMAKALDLLGNQQPNLEYKEYRISSAFSEVSCYSTLDFSEFEKFVRRYEEQQFEDYMEVFRKFDADGLGMVQEKNLIALFEACHIPIAFSGLKEAVSRACLGEEVKVTPDDFRRLVDLLRVRDGFSSRDLQRYRSVFNRFEIRKNVGKLGTEDLFSAVTWLAYPDDYKSMVNSICAEVDVGNDWKATGELSYYDFIVCLRKTREHDHNLMMTYMEQYDEDNSGTIDRGELLHMLRKLGYMPDPDAIDEALLDAGLDIHQDLDTLQLQVFLDVYRKREGLTRAEIAEIDDAFARYHRDDSGEISALEVGKVLRWMAYMSCWDLQQRLIAEVDIDHSGRLSIDELRKLVRKYREREMTNMKRAFEEQDQNAVGTIDRRNFVQALRRIGCAVDSDFAVDSDEGSDHDDEETVSSSALGNASADEGSVEERQYDVFKFVQVATKIRQKARAHFRDNAGYTEDEVAEFQVKFAKYDKDGSGEICNAELRVLLEDVLPELAHSAKLRPHLLKLLEEADEDGNGDIDFQDFLRLMRQVNDLHERDRLMREQQAIEATQFSFTEIEEFRQLFIGSDEDHVRTKLSLADLKRMLQDLCPLGAKHVAELTEIFKQACLEDEESKMVAHFPEFLLIMHRLLEQDFAGIKERTAEATKATRASPKKTKMRSKVNVAVAAQVRRRSCLTPMF